MVQTLGKKETRRPLGALSEVLADRTEVVDQVRHDLTGDHVTEAGRTVTGQGRHSYYLAQ